MIVRNALGGFALIGLIACETSHAWMIHGRVVERPQESSSASRLLKKSPSA